MNDQQKVLINADIEIRMQASLEAQRTSYLNEGMVSASTRIDRIDRAIDALVRHSESISNAMNEDFGCRPRQVNLMTDVSGSIGCLKHCRQNLTTSKPQDLQSRKGRLSTNQEIQCRKVGGAVASLWRHH